MFISLLAILGDNLGLNSVLGFSESFNSDFFCRICATPKIITRVEYNVSRFVERTAENYDLDCENCSHGIKEPCIWNELGSFHVTRNLSCDLMHDLLLGVLRYDLAFIINHLIKAKYLTLNLLNERIKFFKFSKVDSGNNIPQIKQEHLKKNMIVISASEMMALTLYLGVLIGDLVPEYDSVWIFYTVTVQILENLLAESFSEASLVYLTSLIVEHHSLFLERFEETLRPKYHLLLLHYPKIIRLLGPPRYYWSMRYESFHRLLKISANSITCRKNLLKSLSVKQQLRFSARILSKKGLILSSDHGPSFVLHENLTNVFPGVFTNNAKGINWISVNNFYFKIGLALQIPAENDMFGIIKYIVLDKNEICFAILKLKTLGFSNHLQCYEVTLSKTNILNLFLFSSLQCKHSFNMHYTSDGKTVICTIK